MSECTPALWRFFLCVNYNLIRLCQKPCRLPKGLWDSYITAVSWLGGQSGPKLFGNCSGIFVLLLVTAWTGSHHERILLMTAKYSSQFSCPMMSGLARNKGTLPGHLAELMRRCCSGMKWYWPKLTTVFCLSLLLAGDTSTPDVSHRFCQCGCPRRSRNRPSMPFPRLPEVWVCFHFTCRHFILPFRTVHASVVWVSPGLCSPLSPAGLLLLQIPICCLGFLIF